MKGYAKRFLFIAIAIGVLVLFAFVPCPEGLGRDGMLVIGLTLFNIVLWMGNVVPKPIAGLIVLLLLPLLGITDGFSATYKTFISSVFFFLLAAFAIAAMIHNSDLPKRLMAFFLNKFGNSTKKIVLAFMIVSAIISTVMSDLAACALFSAVAFSIFDDESMKEEARFDDAFVKCIMIGIPIGSLTGGIATPIGSSSNITMLELLTQTNGMEITFLQWMIIGVPIAIISVILSWIALTMMFRPAPLSHEQLGALQRTCYNLGKLSTKEIKILVLLALMFGMWIATSWVKVVDSTAVAVIGMIIMFLPGMDLLTWDEYSKEVPWDLVIMLGCLMALAASMLSTGAIDWVAESVLGNAGTWNPYLVLFAIGAVIALLRAFIPSGPPIVVMLTPALIAIAQSAGLNGFAVIMAMSIWAQITFLLPAVDALYLITYSKGYYTIPDVLKFGLPLTIILLVLFTFLLPPLVEVACMI